jgi:hypothetical protein
MVYETSLSSLSEHDWQILRNRWARGINWFVCKLGRKWTLTSDFGSFPLFTTKTAAYEAGTALILAESAYRQQKVTE